MARKTRNLVKTAAALAATALAESGIQRAVKNPKVRRKAKAVGKALKKRAKAAGKRFTKAVKKRVSKMRGPSRVRAKKRASAAQRA
jgi:hypothetical protein